MWVKLYIRVEMSNPLPHICPINPLSCTLITLKGVACNANRVEGIRCIVWVK